jgi:hypothetical protein
MISSSDVAVSSGSSSSSSTGTVSGTGVLAFSSFFFSSGLLAAF